MAGDVDREEMIRRGRAYTGFFSRQFYYLHRYVPMRVSSMRSSRRWTSHGTRA